MLKVFVFVVTLAVLGNAQTPQVHCVGCAVGKEKLQCDYYVARQADRSRQSLCRRYADYVNIDGAYPKAAWYYLLAGEPKRALQAADRGIDQKQAYAREYRALALWLEGDREAARKELRRFFRQVTPHDYFEKDLATLRRLYPESHLEALKRR
jgi:hypothetical protein